MGRREQKETPSGLKIHTFFFLLFLLMFDNVVQQILNEHFITELQC